MGERTRVDARPHSALLWMQSDALLPLNCARVIRLARLLSLHGEQGPQTRDWRGRLSNQSAMAITLDQNWAQVRSTSSSIMTRSVALRSPFELPGHGFSRPEEIAG